MRNIFLEKSYTKCGKKTIARPFSKESKLSISLDQWSKVLFCFYCMASWRLWNLLKLSCRPLAFTSYKAFLKWGRELVSQPHFLHDFWENMFLVVFYYLIKFHCLVVFTSWEINMYLYQYMYCILLVNQVVTS